MPYDVQWEPKGVYWRFCGEVSGLEVLQSNLEAYGDPRFGELKYQIADFLEIESLDMEPSEVKKLAYLDKAAAKSNPHIKVALVAQRETLEAHARLHADYAGYSPWETEVFEGLNEARAWLGCDDVGSEG
jgi:hypothetical protein